MGTVSRRTHFCRLQRAFPGDGEATVPAPRIQEATGYRPLRLTKIALRR
jgi:hypothetical protein